jgi:hypothetical protein
LFFTATTTTTYIWLAENTATASNYVEFGGLSVKSDSGNHASQATSASRPILRARYNLLEYSEQFDNGYWAKLNISAPTANSVVAPDGTLTAETITSSNSASANTGFYRSLSYAAGHTLSIYAKANTSSIAWVSSNSGESYAVFNLSTGTVISSGNATASITAVPGYPGWYRLIAANTTVASTYFIAGGKDSYTSGHPWSNGTWTSGNSIYMWGADLRTGSSAGTYQRIAAATDYATAGFLPYLAFDGVDDVLVATPASADYILNSVAFGAQFNAFLGNATLGSIGNSATGNSFSYIAENSGTSVFAASARNDAATTLANYIGTTDLLPHVLISIWSASASSVQNNSSIVTGSAFTGVITANKFTLGALGRNTNSAFANSRIYSALFISPALTTAQSASLASYIAAKSGVTL